MVESIGSRLVNTDRGVTRVAATTPPRAASTVAGSPSPPTAQTGGIAQQLAASAPIDVDRVGRIKQAIADGNYPIVPGTIADNMIAMRIKISEEAN